jgi:hypothetical protein
MCFNGVPSDIAKACQILFQYRSDYWQFTVIKIGAGSFAKMIILECIHAGGFTYIPDLYFISSMVSLLNESSILAEALV